MSSKIIERQGHYALTVKDNQPTLLAEIKQKVQHAVENDFQGIQYDQHTTEERGHGRTEKRHFTILIDPIGIPQQNEWESLRVIGMCARERQVGTEEAKVEVSYFIGSHVMSAKRYAKVMRNHWGIENNLHWQLDVTFGEDQNRVSKRNGAENLALLRKLALMMLKRHPSKLSLAGKQWNAALNPQFLEEVLLANANTDKI